jgi:putative tryptophan/tyrosine transport system substrate-binding protein
MKRRKFIVLTAGAVTCPWLAHAQQPRRLPTIAVLLITSREPFISLFREGLRDHGYVEGQNIAIELRSTEGDAARLPVLAAELVGMKPDVIVASETPAVAAVKRATSDIPIVMAAAGDPVGTGLIASLARPGGNITGLSAATAEIAGKSLELIREIRPATQRVAVLALAGNLLTKPFVEQIEAVARELKIEIRPTLVSGAGDFDSAFAGMVGDRVEAIVVQPSVPYRRAIELALQHRMLTVSVTRSFPESGGLLSYAGNLSERYRGAATYVAEILKGRSPAELPVGQPTKFELVINLKAAKALGIDVPPNLIARADEIIE